MPESADGSAAEKAKVTDSARAERIEQLRLAVQAGTYQVSAETLANALIEAHLEEEAHLKG